MKNPFSELYHAASNWATHEIASWNEMEFHSDN